MKGVKKFLLGLLLAPFALILYPFAKKFNQPFNLHRQGRYKEALRAYMEQTQKPLFSGKGGALYCFNIGLLYKLADNQTVAAEYFRKAKELGIDEDPAGHRGNQPYLPKGQ